MPAKTQKTARSIRIGQQPAAGGAAGLVRDLAVGQGFLQFGEARGGDLGGIKVEDLQFRHPLDVYQPCVGDLGIPEAE